MEKMELIKSFDYEPQSFVSIKNTWDGYKKVIYCNSCKEVTVSYGYENYYGNKCSNCGHEDDTVYYLSSKSRWLNNVLRKINIYKNDEKIVVSFFFINPYINKEDKISFETSTARVVFNTKVGQVYELPILSGRKMIGDVKHIVNCTYSDLPTQTSSYMVEHEEVLSYLQTLIAPHIQEEMGYMELKLANRLPQLTYNQLTDLSKYIKETYHGNNMSKVFKSIKKKDNAAEFIGKLCKNIGVKNTKGIRKELLEDIEVCFSLKQTKKMGIVDINNKRQLAQLFKYYGATNNMQMFDAEANFIKSLVIVRSEVVATRMIVKALNNSRWLLNDTAQMWKEFCELGYNDNGYLMGNLREIHDRLFKDLDKIKIERDNQPFEYTQNEIALEYATTEYTFKLAKNASEMIIVGRDMSICVGGKYYTELAKRKAIFIVLVTDTNEKYKACIEVENNKNELTLRQVKAFGNNLPKEELAEAIRKWAAKSNVNTKESYDYNNMQ